MIKQGPRKSKYSAVPTVVDGVRFASKAEAKRDAELQLLQKADTIRTLTRQPRFELYVDNRKIAIYVGDWRYWERNTGQFKDRQDWVEVVEDRKGFKTPAFKLKWKLCKALYPSIEFRLS